MRARAARSEARDAVEGLLISALSDRLTVGAVLKLSCVQCCGLY